MGKFGKDVAVYVLNVKTDVFGYRSYIADNLHDFADFSEPISGKINVLKESRGNPDIHSFIAEKESTGEH